MVLFLLVDWCSFRMGVRVFYVILPLNSVIVCCSMLFQVYLKELIAALVNNCE